MTQPHMSAGVEKLPLVVIQKCSQSVAEGAGFIGPARAPMLDAPRGEGQRLAQMPEDDLEARILVECAL